jgi:transcriptional regulator with XRE-family HTH domain
MALRMRSRLPELLAARGLTQAEFARRLKVSEAFISQIIKGSRYFSYPLAAEAARILKCKIGELYEIYDEKGNRLEL